MSPEHQAALKRAFDCFAERNVACPDHCEWGFIVTDPNDIDTYTEEPRRSHCPTCSGKGFVPRQMSLPL